MNTPKLPPPPTGQDALYTLDEVALRMRVSVSTVRRWIKEKAIRAHKLGHAGAPRAGLRVSESEIQRYLKETLR